MRLSSLVVIAIALLVSACSAPSIRDSPASNQLQSDLADVATRELAQVRSAGIVPGGCALYATFWEDGTVVRLGDNEEMLGLRKGDKVKMVNGQAISRSVDILPALSQINSQYNVSISVIRDSEIVDLELPCRDGTELIELYLSSLEAVRKMEWRSCIQTARHLQGVDTAFHNSTFELLIYFCSLAEKGDSLQQAVMVNAAREYEAYMRMINESIYVKDGLAEIRARVIFTVTDLRQAGFDTYATDLESHYNDRLASYNQVSATPRQRKPKEAPDGSVGIGTCFAVSSDGYLVTNHHVIDGAKEIVVRFGSDDAVPATVVEASEATDLAVLKVSKRGLSYLPVGSSRDVGIGERVFTIGFPLVTTLGLDAKFTDGSISSKSGLAGESIAYQITVPIQPGNSGGPLVNHQGQVIGIITSTASAGAFLEQTGSLPQNINWAVKAEYLKPMLTSAPAGMKARDRTQAISNTANSICMVITKR